MEQENQNCTAPQQPKASLDEMFDLYQFTRALNLETATIDEVAQFMEGVVKLFPSQGWVLINNQNSMADVNLYTRDAQWQVAKEELMDILPLYFFTEDIEEISNDSLVNLLASNTNSDLGAEELSALKALVCHFEMGHHDTLIMIFYFTAADNQVPLKIQSLNEVAQFLRLFIKSIKKGAEVSDLLTENRILKKRQNTWIEALDLINRSQFENADANIGEFYYGVSFQLKVLTHGEFTGLLSLSTSISGESETSKNTGEMPLELADKIKNAEILASTEIGQKATDFVKEAKKELSSYQWNAKSYQLWNLSSERANDFKQVLLYPVFINEELSGIFISARKDEFSQDDILIGQLFIDGIEKLIERRWFVSHLQQANEEVAEQNKHLEDLVVQLKNAQDQMLQSEKLASIGQLAAGVAHEINNPIGYVGSNISNLKTYVEDLFSIIDAYENHETELSESTKAEMAKLKKQMDLEFLKEDLEALINESIEGVKRVKTIVLDLRNFSRTGEVDWQEEDIHQCLDSTLNIAANEIKYKAEVVKKYGNIPKVECVSARLNQVFMNLLVNAAHAISETGTITIETGMESANRIYIKISDTGSGIDEENMKKIFDPFFTTKEIGKGTGLGLSISYGIIEKHKGEISVQSQLGQGTTFTICLPVKQENKGDTLL